MRTIKLVQYYSLKRELSILITVTIIIAQQKSMSLLGKYNTVIDELMHGALSAVVAVVAYKLGLDLWSVVAVFLAKLWCQLAKSG